MPSLSDSLRALLLRRKWALSFTARTRERGRYYAECGRVIELRAAPGPDGNIELHGRIAGSGRNVYECQVKLSPHGRSLVVDARCTCPVEVDCKHAAAMLFAATPELMEYDDLDAAPRGSAPPPHNLPLGDARAALDTVSLTQWQHWLSNLGQPPSAGSHASPEQTFGVLLRAAALDQLAVLPAWLRPSKRANAQGVLVDPQPVTLDERRGAVPPPADGWSNDDADALTTILHAPVQFIGNQHWRTIASPYVERALEALLDHYPAYFERGSVPLQRGVAVAVTLAWRESENGRQRLVMTDGALAGCLILRGEGYWYIDPARRTYGHIDGDARLLRQLQYAPELTPDAVAMAREQLAKSALTERIPLPVVRERGPDIHVAPTPVLHLDAQVLQERWSFQRHRVAFGWLAFDYAGAAIEAIPPTPVAERIVDGRICTIRRNPEAESAALRALQLAGLGLLTNDSGYIRPADAPPFAHVAWILRANRSRPPAGPEAWRDVIAILEGQGFRLEYGDGFPRLEVLAAGAWDATLTPSGNYWFDVSLGIDVAGKHVDLLPLLRQLVADPAFPRKAAKREKASATWRVFLDATHCVDLPLAHLRALIEPLLEWLESESSGAPRVHATELGALNDGPIPWRGGDALRAQLTDLERARKPQVPRGLKATLRPYQLDGLAWLDFLSAAGLGGILADDMGLGKTLQVLAHVLGEKQRKRLAHPVLAIVPTSLVGNWASEAARFTPTLKVLVIHGGDRKGAFARIPRHDLVITTYPLLRQDREQLLGAAFSLLVLDEAQTIKNAHSQTARIVRELHAERRIALTGTPMENHLGELWAEFDAVEPGLLGSERRFQRVYRTPIEKHGDAERRQRLTRRVGALLLRRRKEDVLTDLPAKTEMVRSIELEGAQRELYETLRLAQHDRIREAIEQRGFAQAGIIVLDALLKLRQVCCDPRLVKLDSAKKVHASAKLDALLSMLEQAAAEGRHVLVFSQFTEMLGLIEIALGQRGIDHQTLTGQTPGSRRTALVKRFQSGAVPVFLISLKAGGIGLNLTAADTVIHYDPWWNPAVEAQATDRAHRIGQDKPVFVYRLLCAGTVEEKIQALQARKAKLARAILEGGSSQQLRFNEADLDALFGAPV